MPGPDLHLHSTASDGTLAPAEVVREIAHKAERGWTNGKVEITRRGIERAAQSGDVDAARRLMHAHFDNGLEAASG